jgi:mannitol-specific phosphotransferase system IIBC component
VVPVVPVVPRRRELPVPVVLVEPAALAALVALGSTAWVQTVALPGMRATAVPAVLVATRHRVPREPVVKVVPPGTAVSVGQVA